MIKELKTFSVLISCFVLSAGGIHGENTTVATASETAEAATQTAYVAPAQMFLSVEDVIAKVKSENSRVQFSQEGVQRAQERNIQRRAALLPQVSLRAVQLRQQLGSPTGGGTFIPPPFDVFVTRVGATQTVFDARKITDYQLSRVGKDVSEFDYQVAIQDTLEIALQFYFTHLHELGRIELIEGNIDRYSELVGLAREQYDAGKGIRLDVTRAEARLTAERRLLLEAKALAKLSVAPFIGLLHLDPGREIILDRSVMAKFTSPDALKRSVGEVNAAIERRPELAKQRQQIEQARLTRRGAAWQRLPRVELFGEWGHNTAEAFDGDEKEAWLVGLRASIPIFEGGRINSAQRDADAAIRQNQHLMEGLTLREIGKFYAFRINMDARYTQIDVARQEVQLGYDEVEQAEKRYRDGETDNRDLIEAQERLVDAESAHLETIYLYGLSRLTFARSIGEVERVLN